MTLADFFDVDEQWTESRYDIAKSRQQLGIGAEIQSCYGPDAPDTLELRLANNFTTLKFNVGQANGSQASDQVLDVEVIGNGAQIDIRRIPFNKVQPFTIPVGGVNALVIRVYLDPETDQCDGDSVTAVLHGAVLE